MSYSQETRILRDRSSALASAMDRARAGGPAFKSARQLVKVINGGSMPTQPDHYFLCNPCEVDGVESEREAPTVVCGSGTSLAVDFIRGVPSAGD